MEKGNPKEEKGGIFFAILRLFNNILEFFANRQKRQEEERKRKEEERKQKEIEMVKQELKKALAEGRIQDAAYWNKKLQILISSIAIILLLLTCFTGCTTKPPNPISPVIILGERINKVKPGQLVIIPPLIDPSKQWYLADDYGLYQWLEIKLSQPNSKSITNIYQWLDINLSITNIPSLKDK